MRSISPVERLRPFAWTILAVLSCAYVWLLFDNLRFTSAPLSDPMSWVFVIGPGVLAPAPLVGVWLLSEAASVGGGRWGWRWWCGALLVGLFVDDLARTVVLNWNRHVFHLGTAHPFLEYVLTLVGVGPVAVVAYRAKPL
jgi:hypothetical protein